MSLTIPMPLQAPRASVCALRMASVAFLHGGVEAEGSRDVRDVVVDGLGYPDDRDFQSPLL
jgi:hypothetical protein